MLIQKPRLLYQPDTNAYPYQAVQCKKISPVGFRMELGASFPLFLNSKSSVWFIRGGPELGLDLAIRQFNLGVRGRIISLKTLKPTRLGLDSVSNGQGINLAKLELYLGYSIDLKGNFSLEPQIGYSYSSFYVLNQKNNQESTSLPHAGGMWLGLDINKYFRLKNYCFGGLFFHSGYTFVCYSSIHSELGAGHFDLQVGLMFKGFFTSYFLKRV